MHREVGYVRLGSHVVVLVFLFPAKSAVISRAVIKQTFRDVYSDRQRSGQQKLRGTLSPTLSHTSVACSRIPSRNVNIP